MRCERRRQSDKLAQKQFAVMVPGPTLDLLARLWSERAAVATELAHEFPQHRATLARRKLRADRARPTAAAGTMRHILQHGVLRPVAGEGKKAAIKPQVSLEMPRNPG